MATKPQYFTKKATPAVVAAPVVDTPVDTVVEETAVVTEEVTTVDAPVEEVAVESTPVVEEEPVVDTVVEEVPVEAVVVESTPVIEEAVAVTEVITPVVETPVEVVVPVIVEEAPVVTETIDPVTFVPQAVETPVPDVVTQTPLVLPLTSIAVTAEVTNAAEQVIIATSPVVQAVVTTIDPTSSFDAAVGIIKATGTVLEVATLESLESYVRNMAPGVGILPEQGANQQTVLWKLISNICERNPEEFETLFSLVLLFLEEYQDGVFNERYIHRFAEALSISSDQINAFQRIITLMKMVANPKTRRLALKQINLEAALSVGFSEEARQRILYFVNK